MRSTPVRRRRKALPAESLRGKGPRVRRRAAGRARLSRWAWPRDIGSIMLTPIRKPTLTRGRYAYHITSNFKLSCDGCAVFQRYNMHFSALCLRYTCLVKSESFQSELCTVPLLEDIELAQAIYNQETPRTRDHHVPATPRFDRRETLCFAVAKRA